MSPETLNSLSSVTWLPSPTPDTRGRHFFSLFAPPGSKAFQCVRTRERSASEREVLPLLRQPAGRSPPSTLFKRNAVLLEFEHEFLNIPKKTKQKQSNCLQQKNKKNKRKKKTKTGPALEAERLGSRSSFLVLYSANPFHPLLRSASLKHSVSRAAFVPSHDVRFRVSGCDRVSSSAGVLFFFSLSGVRLRRRRVQTELHWSGPFLDSL